MNSENTALEEYDVLILGSGEAGKYLAWTLAQQSKRVALVERQYIGGSCPNIACLPSKNIIHSAKVASYFFRSEEFGITKENASIHMSAIRDRKGGMVNDLLEVHKAKFKASGAALILGTGRFLGPKTIEVSFDDGSARVLRGEKVVVSTGSRATIEAIPGLREAGPLTHIETLELDHIPDHLVILGGGYVGLEFAQAMRRFGSLVTIIERNERLVHREDPDVSALLQDLFQKEGITIVTNARVTRIQGKSGEAVKLHATQGESEIVLEGSHLLVASGRTPNTQGIGLERAGVATTDRGFVQVNERLETTAPDVYAVGDCAGSPHFTHIAFDDFRIVRDNIAGGNRVTTDRQVPFCLFTDPEFARVGLSESEAKARGIAYRLAKIPMAAVPRARTLAEMNGFMKALVDTESDRILGFTAVCVGAGELLAPVQLAMTANLPFTVLRDAVFTHPTISEGLVFLFMAVPNRKSPNPIP